MFRHYLTTALRNLAANRLQSAIAILGLAVGLWAAIVAGLLIVNQTSYDSFIPGSRSLYVVAMKNGLPGLAAPYGKSTPHDLAALLQQNFAQVKGATRLDWGRSLMRRGDIRAKENIFWADANFFALLPLPVLYGDRDKALARPDGIVLPLSIARKYFGRDNVVGQTITLGEKQPHVMTVTAVIADLPQNASTLETVVPEQAAGGEPGIIVSGKAPFSSIARAEKRPNMGDEKGRFNFDVQTILRLAPEIDVAALEDRISSLMNARLQLDRKSQVKARLFRLDQVNVASELSPGIATRLGIFAVVALLVLVLACVNFVNLSVARAARRGVEVGIRKAAGASRMVLAAQFLGEAVVQALMALVVAVALVEWSVPAVNAFLQTGAVFDYWHDLGLMGFLVLGTLSVGVLAGAYPAFVLSSFRPRFVLKGGMDVTGGAGLLRQILVGLQFAILIVMVAASWVVLDQYRYETRDALRVETDQMLFLRDDKCDSAFETGVSALPGVRGTTCSTTAVLPELFEAMDVKRQGGGDFPLNLVSVGYGFLELYGLTPVAGRFFARSHSDAVPDDAAPTYAAHYVINETAARKLGFASPQAAIGKAVWFGPPPAVAKPALALPLVAVHFGSGGANPLNGIVIGVVRDFSLYPGDKPILPIAYSVGWTTPMPPSQLFHVKLRGHDIPETLIAIDGLWARTQKGALMDRTFVDSYVQNLVIAVLRQGQAFAVLAGIAVLLACLGLFALSISTAERRTKEIGIRKAMGASSGDIVLLLLWQFLKPVLWAGAIAMPLAWWLMQRWLSGYAYHVALGPLPFLGAAALAVVIALATVVSHAVLTARAVPANALRYE
jgi:putative ABC transport system permease protein